MLFISGKEEEGGGGDIVCVCVKKGGGDISCGTPADASLSTWPGLRHSDRRPCLPLVSDRSAWTYRTC